MSARDTPLMTALRHIEWDYGRAGWHGDEGVDPTLYALHYRSAKRRTIEARVLPVRPSTWRTGPVVVLSAFRVVLERENTAVPVTGGDPLWCGLALAAEMWAADSRDGPGWRDTLPSLNPLRRTGRVVVGVLAEDLAVVTVYRDQMEDRLLTDTPVTMVGAIAHALTTAVATVEYQRELDEATRRTGTPAQ